LRTWWWYLLDENPKKRFPPIRISHFFPPKKGFSQLVKKEKILTMFQVVIYSTILAVAVGQGYGPLYPTKDMSTGLELLALPEGFSYMSYGACFSFEYHLGVTSCIIVSFELSGLSLTHILLGGHTWMLRLAIIKVGRDNGVSKEL
jgi:hypothetical protein